jgi:hypothetical protein
MWRLAILPFCVPLFAYGCSVVELPEKTLFAYSSVVFEGTVTEVRHFESEEQRSLHSRTLVTFSVSRKWK